MDGHLSGKRSPQISIELYGLHKPEEARLFRAVIDTGFTGGISMPVIRALPLGLVLFGLATFTLADGSKEETFLCRGKARLNSQEREVVFALTKGDDVLIGTEFLESFKAKLELDYEKKVFSIKLPTDWSEMKKELEGLHDPGID